MSVLIQRIQRGALRTYKVIAARYRSLRTPFKVAIPTLTVALVAVLILSLVFLSSPAGQAFASGVYTSSATDSNGNSLLSSNTVVDSQLYDTTQDSSATTQRQLGVDPNEGNGTARKSGALYFDSSNDYISTTYNSAYDFGAGSSFTVSAWVKLNSVPSSNMGILGTASYQVCGYTFYIASGTENTYIRTDTAGVEHGAGFGSIPLASWQLLTATMDSVGTIRTYLNGSIVATTTGQSITSCGSSRQFLIGNSKQGMPEYFSGNIDDVRIYGRVLTTSEVQALYARQAVSETSLVGNWKLDDLAGTSALDSSPYGDTGTLLNGAGNSPAADGTTNGPIWVSGDSAIMDGFKGCGPEDLPTCTNPSNQPGAGNVSITADSSTASGNGYDVQVVNPPGLTFDGSNDFVQTSNSNALQFANQTFTVSGWFKTTVAGAGIVSDGGGGSSGGGWNITDTGSVLQATLKDSTSGGVFVANGTKTVTDGTWHSFTVVFTTSTTVAANNTAVLYLDGAVEPISSSTRNGNVYNVTPGSRYLGFGARDIGGTPANFFNGAMSDMRIFARGLTAAEAAAINANQPISNLSLTAWWKMNEGTGASLTDLSGNAYTGTLMNGASNSPAADGTTNGPIWSEGPSPVVNPTATATSTSPAWAGSGYSYRQQINVANASGATLPAGYAVNSPVTWGSLLNQNQSRTDGNDFRIFHQPTDSVRSISISGTSQNLSVPASTSLTTNNASVSIWVKSTMTATGFSHVFAHDGFSTGSPGYEIMTYNGTSNVAFRIDTSAGTNQATSCVLSNVFNGKWNLLTYTVDSGGAVKGYLNGVATCSTTYTVGTGIANTIAADFQGNSGAAESVDDARVYNAVLTPSQVAAIYNGGAGTPNAIASGLVGWWRLDEGSGQIVSDSSGNGNNGYLGTTSGSDINDPTWNSTAGNGTPDGVVSTSYEIPRYIPKASALTFDGSATKVAITNPAGDQVAMPSGSMSVWYNRSAQDDTLRAIYDIAGTGSNGLILMGDGGTVHGCTAGALYFQWGTGSGTWGKCGPVPTNGTWYQATATWNSLGTKLYINGSLYASDTAHLPSITLGASSYLGSNGGTIRFFNGVIGEARLYNKTLSAADVAQLYANASTKVVNPQANLLEAWRMDEGTGTTANDASGVGANGTITMGSGAWLLNQAITPSTQQAYFATVAPIANSASSSGYYLYYGNPTEQNSALSSPQTSRTGLYFDGAAGSGFNNDDVSIPAASSINDLGTFTWSAWINPASSGLNNLGRIFDKAGRLLQFTSGSPQKLTFAQNFASGQNSWVTTSNVITFNTWQLVTLTYDSSSTANTPTLYINGTSVPLTAANATGSGAILSDAGSTLNIGNRAAFGRALDGNLDDARMYNRILSSTEAADLYSSGNTPPVSSNGLVGWWKLDEASGTSTSDSSGNSNTGTLTNFNFNTTDGWTNNPNLWQVASVTTNTTGFAAQTETPRYIRYATVSSPVWATPTWSTEMPMSSGPIALGATGVKIRMNPNGFYSRYDTFHIASWAVEAPSSIRGTRRSVPEKLNMIADGTSGGGAVDLINAATNTLWMRIPTGSNSSASLMYTGDNPTNVTALNGHIYIGKAWNTAGGILDFSLASDNVMSIGTGGLAFYQGDVAQRNSNSGFDANHGILTTFAGQRAPNARRALAVQVINGKTYLAYSSPTVSSPAPVLGVEQDISSVTQAVISRTSLTQVKYSRTASPSDTYNGIALSPGGILYAYNVTQGGLDRWDTIPTDTTDVLGSVTRSYLAIGASTGANSIAVLPSATVNAIAIDPGESMVDSSNEITVGTPSGAVVIDEAATIGSSQVYYLEQTGSTGTSGWNSKGFGNVIETDGVSTRVNVPSSSTLDPASSDFTVEGWFKTTMSCGSFCDMIFRRTGGGTTPGYNIFLNSTNHLDATFSTASGQVDTISTGAVNDGVWHHFALVRTTLTTQTLFLDGVLQQTTTNAGLNTSITTTAALSIGGAGASLVAGQIDELRISNVARYTANFTPQKTEFISDANTMGLWHFDEPYGQYLADSSGNKNTGTLGANSSVSTDDPLHVSPSLDGAANVSTIGYQQSADTGSGLTFDGSSSYVTVPDSTSLHLTTAITISGWFKPASAWPSPDGTSHFQNIVSRAISGSVANQVYILDWNGTNASSVFRINVGDGTSQSSNSYSVGALTPGQWYLVTGVWTPTAQALFVNGVRVTTTSVSTVASAQAAAGTALRIGGWDFGSASTQFLSGSLDDVRLYNTVLSDAQVAALYNGGRGWNGGKDSGLVGGWNFNEKSGTSAADYSGNSNTGTLTTTGSQLPTWLASTPVRSQLSLWIGTNDNSSAGAVTAVSLTTGRQIKSYNSGNSVLPAYSVDALSVGSGGLALVGTGGGAWSPGSAGTVVEDPLLLASLPVTDVRIKGGVRLEGGDRLR